MRRLPAFSILLLCGSSGLGRAGSHGAHRADPSPGERIGTWALSIQDSRAAAGTKAILAEYLDGRRTDQLLRLLRRRERVPPPLGR